MAINPIDAISAFNKAANLGGIGLEPREGKPVSSFIDLVKEAAEKAIVTGEKAELKSAEAIVNDAEIADVVTAISNAEITLQTIVAVRDRILTAYQEILRMPI